MSTIMVLVDNHPDTLAGLHEACTLAQRRHQEIALVQLIPVNHPALLGSEWGGMNFRDKDRCRLEECQRLVEGHEVDVKTYTVQTISTVGGIVCAAEQVNACVVFAHLPHGLLPLWTRWEATLLRQRLAQTHCELYLYDRAGHASVKAHRPSVAHN